MVDRLSDFAKYCTDEQYENFMCEGTGEPLGILNVPGVAMLVDDGVTRGPMGSIHAITLEDVQAMYRRLTPPAYRPASLLPASVNHE